MEAQVGSKIGDVGSSGPKGHIPGLDGIRGLAIGLVLFSHSVIFDEFSDVGPIGLGSGYAGVTVFFVLSGYLITTLLIREEERTGGISLRLFYIRRGLRLFPALWLYLLVVGLIWFAGGLPQHPWHSFGSSLLYVRNLVGRGHETGHLWSLSIEEQFYLVWPIFFILLPRRNGARLFLALGLIASVTAWRVFAAGASLVSPGTLYIRSDFRFDAPLFGCALALTLRVAPSAVCWLNATERRSGTLAIAATAGLLAWVILRCDALVYPGTDITVVCLFSALLVISQIGVQGPGSRWLAWSPLAGFGQISYGIYLWQQLFLGPQVDGFQSLRTFPIGLIATFTAATISYWCVEKPLLKLKDRMYHPVFPSPSPEDMHRRRLPIVENA